MVNDFYRLLDKKYPDGADLNFLSALLVRYPYLVSVRKMYLKALLSSGNIHFQSEMSKSLVYMSDKRNFYFYLYPDLKIENQEPLLRKDKFTGSYFDFLELAGEEKENSLKKLAEKLKEARGKFSSDTKSKRAKQTQIQVPVVDYFKLEDENTADILVENEENVKDLIKNKNYTQALELLRKLNLNNPKKSVYFADQIRFLEKVIQFQHN